MNLGEKRCYVFLRNADLARRRLKASGQPRMQRPITTDVCTPARVFGRIQPGRVCLQAVRRYQKADGRKVDSLLTSNKAGSQRAVLVPTRSCYQFRRRVRRNA